MPRVSIITAVRDGARTIAETIASVQSQREADWEHIVVDDGSVDATAAVLAQHPDPRRRTVAQPPAGCSVARNRGIELARGEWLLFLDADDWLEPNALSDHLAELARRPECDASIADGWFCSDDGALLARFSARRAPLAGGDILPALVANPGLYGAPLAIMVRAAAVRAHGVRFDPGLTIGEDNRFVLELARHIRFAVVDAITCRYRWHAQSTTLRADAATRRTELWRALAGVLEFPEFARLPQAAREEFIARALTAWLADRPAQQQELIASPAFGSLPAAVRARLLRLAASEHLLAARDRDAAGLLREAASLTSADARLTLLRALLAVHPRLAALAVRARRSRNAVGSDPLRQLEPASSARRHG